MSKTTSPPRPAITIERTYEAAVEDLWELWTTKEGFESWWGPEGFRVEVHRIDPRVGGELAYDMIACSAETIAAMQEAGRPSSHRTRGVFAELAPHRRLALMHVIDFLPEVAPYEHHITVDFLPEGEAVRMVVAIGPHADEHWTRQSVAGFESQLTKIPAALARRR